MTKTVKSRDNLSGVTMDAPDNESHTPSRLNCTNKETIVINERQKLPFWLPVPVLTCTWFNTLLLHTWQSNAILLVTSLSGEFRRKEMMRRIIMTLEEL